MLLGRREIGSGTQNALPERSSRPGQCLEGCSASRVPVGSCDEGGCKASAAPVGKGTSRGPSIVVFLAKTRFSGHHVTDT
eukprot:1987215-Rhodomonas_salina.1